MNTPLINAFKAFYKNLHQADLSQLDQLYAEEVIFKDPVHQIRGLVSLQDYFANVCIDLSECRFEYLDELHGDNSSYIKWMMHFKHPKLGDKAISVRGVSHLQWGEKIVYHEDFYDMGAMIYEQVPLLKFVIRSLKSRLGDTKKT